MFTFPTKKMSRDNTFLGYPVTYKFIIVILGLATFVHSGLMNGSMNVIVSSLQKEFYLSSQETGYYLSSYDVGSVIGSLVIPLVSTRFGSKPRWIGKKINRKRSLTATATNL